MKKSADDISERVKAGLARAARYGRKGGRPVTVSDKEIRATFGLKTEEAAGKLGLSVSTYIRRRRRIEEAESDVRPD